MEAETNDRTAVTLRVPGDPKFDKRRSRFTLERGGVKLARRTTRSLRPPGKRRLWLRHGYRGVDAWALAIELHGGSRFHNGTLNLDVWHNWLFASS